MTTALGIDFGEQRVGVALWHEPAPPRPLETLENNANLLNEIKAAVDKHAVNHVVVGLPRSLDGQETAQTAAVRAFAAEATEYLQLPLTFQDEAATTSAAAERLARQYGSRRPPAGLLDQEAATIILEDYVANIPHE